MSESALPRGLYVLTRETDDTAALLAAVEAALIGGATAVQYRDKSTDVARRHEQASELAALCRARGVPLIVNDDVRLADLAGADGVHLGRDDARITEARIVLGSKKIIGASCYQSFERAEAAEAAGADYVAFGSVFPSSTKPDANRAPLELFAAAREHLRVPAVAIGGIHAGNAGQLAQAGAHAIAVLSAVFDAADPAAAAHALTRSFDLELPS